MDEATSGSTRQVEQLALLTVAIFLGVVGFLWSFLWIAAIVVLAVLWGYQASSLKPRRADGGLASALVSTAVHEARNIADDVADAKSKVDKQTEQSDEDGEPSKQELYKAAQEAEIPGRSTMSKDELRDALND